MIYIQFRPNRIALKGVYSSTVWEKKGGIGASLAGMGLTSYLIRAFFNTDYADYTDYAHKTVLLIKKVLICVIRIICVICVKKAFQIIVSIPLVSRFPYTNSGIHVKIFINTDFVGSEG